MKKIVLTALGASLLVSSIASVWAEGKYYDSSKETVAYKQTESNNMRLEYYNKYKGKGYNVSLLDAYLDSSRTTDSQFWEALKQVQNNHEVPDRRAYVAKLKNYGYDVSGFSEAVIWDSGRFWDMVRMVESGKKPAIETKKEEVKKEEVKKVETKKEEVKKVEEKKEEVKKPVVRALSTAQQNNLARLMRARIARIPEASRAPILERLETALTQSIARAEERGNGLLVARYSVLLRVVQEEMQSVDDESLIESLFAQ